MLPPSLVVPTRTRGSTERTKTKDVPGKIRRAGLVEGLENDGILSGLTVGKKGARSRGDKRDTRQGQSLQRNAGEVMRGTSRSTWKLICRCL